jgi:hypothetical protein
MRPLTRCCLVLPLLLMATRFAYGEERLRLDFEGETGLGSDWTVSGPVEVSREELPSSPSDEPDGPAGRGVRLAATGPSLLSTRPDRPLELDWAGAEELSFWVLADDEPPVLEVWLSGPEGAPRFWRRIDLTPGWQQVRVPLRWVRWGSGRIPQWSEVTRLGFYLRGAGRLWFDEVRVDDDPTGPGATLSLDDLRALVSPDAPASVRVRQGRDVWLLTDCDDLDLDALVGHLDAVAAALHEELPGCHDQRLPLPLLVFAEEASYGAYVPRLAAAYGAASGPPETNGYTLQGIAASSYDPRRGSLRSVYVHELVHVYLQLHHLLDADESWLSEGLATRYQLRYHYQDLAPVVREGLARPGWHDPLPELCDGRRLGPDRHWQAMTVLETLLEDDPQALDTLLSGARRAGSSDLGPMLESLGTDWDRLDARWRERCRERY